MRMNSLVALWIVTGLAAGLAAAPAAEEAGAFPPHLSRHSRKPSPRPSACLISLPKWNRSEPARPRNGRPARWGSSYRPTDWS